MQSFMGNFDKQTNYFTNMQGVPPSRLGFVCKPDMPPHINILFRARPPLEYVPLPDKGKSRPYEGVFGINQDLLDKFEKTPPGKHIPDESKRIMRLKSVIEKIEKNKLENKEKIKQWNPKTDSNIQGDPYKTIFVYKLDYKTDEKKLKREFEIYGPIKRVRVVKDEAGKSRGYAFIEFEHKSDFKNAYKKAERKRIDDARVSVDYERGRAEKNWKPRRFGGGRGESRPLPIWLEKELKEIKEIYPEIIMKYKRKSSRSRSRNKDVEIKDNYKEENINNIVSQNNVHNINTESNQQLDVQMIFEENINFTNPIKNSNFIESNYQEININLNKENFVLPSKGNINVYELTPKGEEEYSDEDGKSLKKKKKEKKEKRDRKDKKKKKDRKEKRDKRDKNSSEVEIGEIV